MEKDTHARPPTSSGAGTPAGAGGAAAPAGYDRHVELLRIKKASQLATWGFVGTLLLAVAFGVATLLGFEDATAVSVVVSPFLTVLGTLVGAFFGLQIGSSGKEQLADEARDAHAKATAMATQLSPERVDAAMAAYARFKNA